MSDTEPSRAETIRRLNEQANALEARTARPVQDYGSRAVGGAYRLLGELIGGVLVGLALGFGVDFVLDTAPAGIIGGVLLGFAVSVFLAMRTARRLGEQMKRDGAPPAAAVPFNEDEE
jgi:ATP synthase protein I